MRLMDRLQRRINQGLTLQRIADVAGKSPSSISRFANGSFIIDLHAALKIVKAFFPDEEAELMVDFCQKMDRRGRRTAIEYAIVNAQKPLFHEMLENLRASSNRIDNEWAKAYEYEHLFYEKKVRPLELLDRINKTKTESVEMKVYLFILSSYCYYRLEQFGLVRDSLFEAELHMNQINDGFIKGSFSVRLGQALSVVSLSLNEMDDCRKYSKLVIENDLFYSLSGPAYHALGHSYLFESYEQAIYFLNKAREVFLIKGLETVAQVEHSIDFVQIYYHQDPIYMNKDNSTNEISNKVFYHIMKNNDHEALRILDQMDVDTLPDFSKGFHYYYRGLLTKEEKYYYESIYHFKKSGDLFFRQLPCIHLQQKGVSAYVLKTLSI